MLCGRVHKLARPYRLKGCRRCKMVIRIVVILTIITVIKRNKKPNQKQVLIVIINYCHYHCYNMPALVFEKTDLP